MTGSRAGEADRAGTGNVNGRPWSNPCGDRTMIAGGENIREESEVFDLSHGLIPIRELQQVEVRIGYHHVLRLTTDPAAHVHVAISRAGAGRIHIQADASLAFLAVGATTTGNVEGDTDDVTFLDELHVAACLDDFARDFMAKDQALLGGGTATHHVLVRAADVGADDFEDDSVLAFALLFAQLQFWEINALNFDLSGPHVGDTLIARHNSVWLLVR